MLRWYDLDLITAADGLENMNFKNNYADLIRDDLTKRPKFDIRTRIAIGFLLTFVLTFGASIFAMMQLSSLVKKQRFLENASNFEFEIRQARRFEKNYFFYNSNLVDVLYHIQKARSILAFFEEDMRRVMGDNAFEDISEQLIRYGDSVEK